jgi:hypothetical protein
MEGHRAECRLTPSLSQCTHKKKNPYHHKDSTCISQKNVKIIEFNCLLKADMDVVVTTSDGKEFQILMTRQLKENNLQFIEQFGFSRLKA